MHYRDIWKKYSGDIPKDVDGRPYEIHHKDGNRSNNSIENLLCLSIQEHFNTHLSQGDYAAAGLISKRMGLPVNYMSNIQKGKKRPEMIGKCGPKKGNIPWNKDISGYKLNVDRKGKRFSSKLTQKNVDKIREDFNLMVKVPNMESMGKNGANGIKITYKVLFCKEYAKKYNVTCNALKRILNNETWKSGTIDVRF